MRIRLLLLIFALAACFPSEQPAVVEPTETLAPAPPLPTPTAVSPTPTPGPPIQSELSYIGSDGEVWVMDRDRTLLAPSGVCDRDTIDLAWSADGQRLACIPRHRFEARLRVLDNQGAVTEEHETVADFGWSPRGHQLAVATLQGRPGGAFEARYQAAGLGEWTGGEGALWRTLKTLLGSSGAPAAPLSRTDRHQACG